MTYPIRIGLALVMLGGCALDEEPQDDDESEAEEALYENPDGVWTTHDIHVCWTNPNDTQAMGWTRDALATSWSAHSPMRFTGWARCTPHEPAGAVRIRIADVGAGAGDHAVTLNFTLEAYRGDTNCYNNREACIRGIAVHEFGHILGFAHEFDRSDETCTALEHHPIEGGIRLGPYDPDSIMNYKQCKSFQGNQSWLTKGDIAGLRAVYAGWETLPGAAYEVAVGAHGGAFVLGRHDVAGGHAIYRWTGSGFTQFTTRGAYYIAVDPSGHPWIVDANRDIYRWTGTAWQRVSGKANGIGIGANGAVWVVGNSRVAGGYAVYRLMSLAGSTATWRQYPGAGAISIAVTRTGAPWITDQSHVIRKLAGTTWTSLPGRAIQLAIGPEDTVVAVGTLRVAGGFAPYMWTGRGWVRQQGGVLRVAVQPDGRPWAVNNTYHVFRGE